MFQQFLRIIPRNRLYITDIVPALPRLLFKNDPYKLFLIAIEQLILLFLIGCVIMKTRDITWLIFLLVYGVDGCCTIVHRIMLHENLGEAHRKHAYQLMANELGMSHVVVSLIYMGLQLVISLGFVYLCPATVLAHWVYLVCAGVVLVAVYVLFMKKYYHLHAEYLESLKK